MSDKDSEDACEFCRTGRAVSQYAEAEFSALARRAIHQLRSIPATGIYGDDWRNRTLWDEYCHEAQSGPHDLLEDAWARSVHPLIEGLAEDLPRHEAALLTLAAAWDDEGATVVQGKSTEPTVDIDLIRAAIQKRLDDEAGSRDLTRFNPASWDYPRCKRR